MVEIKHPPAEDGCWHNTDGVGDGEGDQHLDVLGEHVVVGAGHRSSCLPLIDDQPPCDDAVSNQDNQEITKDIYNHAVAGMISVGIVTTIHGVCPLVFTGNAKDITGDCGKAPDPNEENDKINSSIAKDWIIVLAMERRVAHQATL